MRINDLACTLNMPRRLQQRFSADQREVAQSLPERNRRAAFVVDEYPACPDNWMRGSAKEASYFVPVLADHGLWLDFNDNKDHSHHVAAVISIQGVNAITGQPTSDMYLEQYRDNCPVHQIPFGHERFCEKCGYKWEAQNYLAGNAQSNGYFWLDGFRAKDGETRQFYFTEETLRGVAAQILGSERVFAIGIAFFLSKEPKPQPVVADAYGYLGGGAMRGFLSSFNERTLGIPDFQERTLEIAAGAKINQRIHPDPESLDFWQPEPAGVIYVNYVDAETGWQIVTAGKRDLEAQGEGFMSTLKVGVQT
ncbi:MAG: hypothetical protein WCX08_00680 [Candidatus Buchananbacteria bacterium]|jgi:hypothetical protein